jgi:hypothetical protein
MELAFSIETVVAYYKAIWGNNLEDTDLISHLLENLTNIKLINLSQNITVLLISI